LIADGQRLREAAMKDMVVPSAIPTADGHQQDQEQLKDPQDKSTARKRQAGGDPVISLLQDFMKQSDERSKEVWLQTTHETCSITCSKSRAKKFASCSGI
jgi:hypothetical protein